MAILIIEDEFLVAEEIRFHLVRAGFSEIEHAATERDALAAIAGRQWDAAVLDANLDGTGVERIVEALQMRSIRFAIVTGYGRQGLPKTMTESVPVITKPFKPGTLTDTLARLCARGPAEHPEGGNGNT